MNAVQAIRVLGPIDAKSVWRDSFLRWMSGLAVGIGLLNRWGVPALTAKIQAEYQFDLVPYYPLLMGFALVLMPTLAGMVVGFLLLDQKDDHTLSALRVTPLSLEGYLVYRVLSPMLLSVVLTAVVLKLSALVPMGWGQLIAVSVAVAPVAPLFALFLATFAANKVQGMALTKANAIFTTPPVVAWFVEGPWQLAFGLTPTYWPCKGFWILAQGQGGYAGYLLAGFLFQIALLWPMMRRFLRVMHRG